MLLSSYLFNNCCLLDGGGENDLIRDFWDVKIKYCHYTQQQNRSLLLVTGKMLNVLLEIMCFIIWHCIKHETQKSFSHFLEHTWMTTQAFFLPKSAAGMQLCILTTVQNYLSLRAKNSHSCKKKKGLGGGTDLLIPVWGAATNCWRHSPLALPS